MKRLLLLALLSLPAFAQESKEGATKEPATQSAAKEAEPERDMTVWMWANFIILAGGLYYLSKTYGAPFFAARADGIRNDISAAEKTKAEADSKIAEINAKLANLSADIAAMREDLQRDQARENQRVQARHESELARVQAQAQQEIQSATKLARLELQREAAALALGLAEKKVAARMNPQTRRELASAFIESIH